jgi:DNA topoisomerase-2
MKIVGLTMSVDYMDPNNFSTLRYGCVMIMTDQDHDGSHIKGLLINFFEHFWPSLLKKNGFLKEFVTPIIKIQKKTG